MLKLYAVIESSLTENTLMKKDYLKHCEERNAKNIPPLALDAQQTQSVVDHLIQGTEDDFYLDLLTNRVPPGVDEAAYVKAGFLANVAKGEQQCGAIDRSSALKLLSTMVGGYNIEPIIDLLDDEELAPLAVEGLSHTLLKFAGCKLCLTTLAFQRLANLMMPPIKHLTTLLKISQ